MNIFRNFKEKNQIKKEEEIRQEAEDLVTVTDFDNKLYIAYGGTPLVYIEETWTTKEIMRELVIVRNNFMNSHRVRQGLPMMAAVL